MKKRKNTRCAFFISSFYLSVFILFLSAVPAHSKVIKKNAVVMGTEMELTVSGVDEALAEKAFNAAKAEMIRIENDMSEWMEGTFVSEVNRNAGVKPVKVTDELFKVISASLMVSSITGGAFDISWASMRGLWDFRPGVERVPAENEIKDRIRLVDYRQIELNGPDKSVFLKKKGMVIGLGGIAKGYAVDRAMEKVAALGVKNAILKAGGDMRVQGTNGGEPWEIGIRNPREKNALIARLKLTNASISTSGDYERFFMKDGVLYHHIIDPKTGHPARGCRSVTILAPDTMTTDALSTAVFVLGPVEGMKLVKSLKGVEAVIVDSEGKIEASPGIDLGNNQPSL